MIVDVPSLEELCSQIDEENRYDEIPGYGLVGTEADMQNPPKTT
jgi:hypothetical protein